MSIGNCDYLANYPEGVTRLSFDQTSCTLTFTAKNINDPQWTPGTYTFRISAIAGINLDVTASFDIELTMGCSVLKSELIWNVP